MDFETWPNLPGMFFEQARRKGSAPFLWAKRDETWQPVSWTDAADQARRLARALRRLGVAPGDRVVVVAENSPEWAIADFAIMAAGAVTVPAYTTNTARDHAHILTDCGAGIAIVSSAKLAAPLLQAIAGLPEVTQLIAIEPPGDQVPGHVTVTAWADALADGAAEAVPPEGADAFDPDAVAAGLDRDAVACLIYTSGTGGAPKGVMLSHRAILANCVGAYHVLLELGLGDEVFLSFLPLSHSYEHSCGLMFPVAIGAQIYYAESVEALSGNLVEVRPTIMTSVPRLYEVMRQRILTGVARAGGLKARLFHLAHDYGRREYENPGGLGLIERLLDGVVERMVRHKVRARFGGRLKAMVSGGAPLNYDVGVFFTALGLRLLQGYGQTEAAPVVSVNPPRKIKMETVGPPLHGVEVRFADDGEILVRGPLLMDGYWNQPDATAAVLIDGWLHTGDIGEADEDGFIKITDRKKDIIVLSGGDNVSPQRIEGILCLEPEIGQAMVIGDQKPHLVALIVPEETFVKESAARHGKGADLATLREDSAFRDAVGDAIERANANLSVLERIKRFAIAREPFSVENEMMTPTMKVRRHVVGKAYAEELERLYRR